MFYISPQLKGTGRNSPEKNFQTREPPQSRHQLKFFVKQKRSNRRSSVSGVPRAGSNQSITDSTSGLNKLGLNGNTTGSSNTINRYWRRPSLKRKPRISRSNSLQQVKTFSMTFRKIIEMVTLLVDKLVYFCHPEKNY